MGGFIVSLPWRWWTDHEDGLKSSECMSTAGHNLDLIVEGNTVCALVLRTTATFACRWQLVALAELIGGPFLFK